MSDRYLKIEENSHYKSNFNQLNLFLQKVLRDLVAFDSCGKTLKSIFDREKQEVGI